MQLVAGMGRAISPVSGVIVAVSKAGECPPFEIVRRTLIPSIGGMITMIVSPSMQRTLWLFLTRSSRASRYPLCSNAALPSWCGVV
jgi:hypothetical protein